MASPSSAENPSDKGLRFDSLFASYHDPVLRYCVRRLGRSEAEDAAADVFAVVWRRLDDVPEGEAAKAWLFGIAHKTVGNRYRARRRQARLALRLKAETDGPRQSRSEQDTELLHIALDGLSRIDQELIRLTSWDGLTRAEIAHLLGIRVNAVDQRLHRARGRLRTRMDLLTTGSRSAEPEGAST